MWICKIIKKIKVLLNTRKEVLNKGNELLYNTFKENAV